MKDLKLLLVQYDIVWHDRHANLSVIDEMIASAEAGSADVIVLPEMFTTGFTMNPDGVAEQMDGPAVQWMAEVAQRYNVTVMGSLALQSGDDFHTRLVCAHQDGTTSSYDKRHLFSYAGEDNVFTPGQHRLTTLCGDGWKVCPMVCYDLRFPVWSRNTDAYDVLIYVANWPSARVDAWNTLLKARAIENQCFTIGVNRTGSDSNGIDYSGSTRVYDMAGDNIVKAGDTPQLLQVTLNHQILTDYRAKYNFLPDQDRFIIV